MTPQERQALADQRLREAGVVFHTETRVVNGVPRQSRVIDHVPELEKEINRFFLGTCKDFPGRAELKRQYDAAIAELETGCSGCARGAIMNMFKPRVREALRLLEK